MSGATDSEQSGHWSGQISQETREPSLPVCYLVNEVYTALILINVSKCPRVETFSSSKKNSGLLWVVVFFC